MNTPREEIEAQIGKINNGRVRGYVSVDATKLEMMEVQCNLLLDIRDLLQEANKIEITGEPLQDKKK